jgi:hypothetical protein
MKKQHGKMEDVEDSKKGVETNTRNKWKKRLEKWETGMAETHLIVKEKFKKAKNDISSYGIGKSTDDTTKIKKNDNTLDNDNNAHINKNDQNKQEVSTKDHKSNKPHKNSEEKGPENENFINSVKDWLTANKKRTSAAVTKLRETTLTKNAIPAKAEEYTFESPEDTIKFVQLEKVKLNNIEPEDTIPEPTPTYTDINKFNDWKLRITEKQKYQKIYKKEKTMTASTNYYASLVTEVRIRC